VMVEGQLVASVGGRVTRIDHGFRQTLF
jgi:hypothetical protein